ncbi:MAG: acyl-CoA dehydrogenase family protein [Deltaproteobacteria bacterium]|nr:acyl-CoA dehydrogenase family protein [Deltaproteobacteria bacterium]
MEFKFNPREEAFRQEVETFLKDALPPDWAEKDISWPGGYGSGGFRGDDTLEILARYRKKLIEKGWNTISWPKEYGGREYTYIEQAIFDERTSYYRAPNIDVIAGGMVAPTILRVGTEAQKKKWIPRIAAGEISMWLGYSEPNAGSDLASIQTTAIQDGDEYVINGQKVWSSLAHISDYAWLIVRTDPSAPRHKSASFFLVETKSPGITIRPLQNILGNYHYNEVFFDNVRVPAENLVGEKNMGFYHLMTALDFERVVLVGIGGFKRILEELVAQVKKTERDGLPLPNIQSVRLKLARIATEIEAGYLLTWRTAEMLDKGLSPSVESSALKLVATELSRKMAEAAMDIFGPYSLIEEETAFTPFRGMAPRGYLDCISATIGAGTSEIQRNIIAYRGLGLPRK